MDRGGKRWRPALMLLCYKACQGKENIDEFIPLVEIMHNGTLMVDDVEDLSKKRRGKPCTHIIYGTDVAINTANLMYFLPFNIIKKTKIQNKTKIKLYETVCDEMLKLHFGQGMDIMWHKGQMANITKEEYLLMCAYKTGTLARMSAKIAAILANADEKTINALGKFAETCGIAFQIQDDILNISSHEWGKDFGDDITEGKRTLMVIRTLEIGEKEDKNRLIEILDKKTTDSKEIQDAVNILKKYGTINYAYDTAKKLVTSALNELEETLKDSKEKEELKNFANFVIERKF